MRRKVIFSALFGVCVFSTLAWGQVTEAWVARYNGPENGLDLANALAVDAAGNVYVTGHSHGSDSLLDYATIKYAANGDTVWVRRYNGTGNGDDQANALAVDGSGNVYVTGYSNTDSNSVDYTTIKYNPSGTLQWVRLFDGPFIPGLTDVAFALAVDGNGNIYVTGSSDSVGGPNYATIKYAPNGDILWIRLYNGNNGLGNKSDIARALLLDDSGNVYITGESFGDSGLNYDYATIKYSTNGDFLWAARYNGPGNGNDFATSLAVDGSGNVYVSGYSYGGVFPSGTSHDYATIKYNSNGDTVWVRRYNGPGNADDNVFSMALDDSGNVFVTGPSWGGVTGWDYATIKYGPAGDSVWVRRYTKTLFAHTDIAYAIAVDNSGNAYVTGESYDPTGSGSSDYATIKYAQNGDSSWVKRYHSGNDYASDIALDTSGNVYVTGASSIVGTLVDYATIKYAQYPWALIIQAYSPVDLIVTDPNGDSISVGFNTISGATYTTANDSVRIHPVLSGNYRIRVVKDPLDFSGDTTYSLSVRIDGKDQAALASNALVPQTGQSHFYVITSDVPIPECLSEPGDANADGNQNLSDVITIVNFVFAKAGCLPLPNCWFKGLNCRGNWNGDASVGLSDAIRAVNFVFSKPGVWNPVPVADCCLPVQ